MRVVREGAVVALVLVGVGGALGRLASWPWAVPWVLLAGGILYFFRDPDREIPNEPHLVLAPADGMVSAVERLSTGGEFGTRFSIFLRMRDVHIIRSPVGGRVATLAHYSSPDTFDPGTANGGNPGLTTADSGVMVQKRAQVSTPSNPDGDTDGFNMAYGSTAPAPPGT